MSRLGRVLVGFGALLTVFLIGETSAVGQTFNDCSDPADPCIEGDDGWTGFDNGGFGSDDMGIPGFFIGFFVLAVLIAIGTTVWKVSTARQIAAQSGMDPSIATQMTLLSEHGLDATYLAANLRKPAETTTASAPVSPPTTAPAASAAQRLTELKGLLNTGMITQTEYAERRAEIIDSV